MSRCALRGLSRVLEAVALPALVLALVVAPAHGNGARAETPPSPRPPGTIRFVAQNLLFKANGEFERWEIRTARIDENAPERSRVEVEIDVSSLDTDNRDRDEHLRSADFFDVARHPKAVVVLEGFRPGSEDRFTADVTLDLHGTTRRFPMTFRVVDRASRRVEGTVVVQRTAFGIGEAESSLNPFSIDDDVEVKVEVIVPLSDSVPTPAPTTAG